MFLLEADDLLALRIALGISISKGHISLQAPHRVQKLKTSEFILFLIIFIFPKGEYFSIKVTLYTGQTLLHNPQFLQSFIILIF